MTNSSSDPARTLWAVSISGVSCASLSTSASSLSLSAGGTISLDIDIDMGSAFAGQFYHLLGSSSGTNPGLSLLGQCVPLNLDTDLLCTVVSKKPPLASNSRVLDGNGAASPTLTLAPATDPSWAGITLHHVALAYSLAPLSFRRVSNPVALELVL